LEYDLFQVHPFGFNTEHVRVLISFRAANMLATLKMIRETYGSAEEYMIEKCGLTKEEVERIRKNMIVEEPAIHRKAQETF